MICNSINSRIPNSWTVSKLGEIAEIVSGIAKGRKLLNRATIWVPYLRVANVQAGRLDLKEIKEIEVLVEEVDKYRLKPGDVVMTEGGDADKLGRGTVWRGEIDLCLHQNHIFRVRPELEILDSNYLNAYLGSKEAQNYFLRCAKQTTGIASINMTQLKAFPISLPSIAEQRRIAEILDRADAIRRKRQEAIALTEELLRSTFLEMFGDPVINLKDWKVQRLENFSTIQTGIAKGKKIDINKAISVPYMRVANVQDRRIDMKEIKELEILPEDIDRYSLRQGDLLLTEGGDPDKLGRGAVWNGEIHPCIHQNHIFCVRPDRAYAEPEYLSVLIGSKYGKSYFLRAAKQTTGIATINKTQLCNFPVLLPPLELQRKYIEILKLVRATQKHLENTIREADELFNSLLQCAFSGRL